MDSWTKFAGAIAVILAAGLAAWAVQARPPTSSGEVAAWVQAIFSVMAVFAAIAVAGWQGRANRRLVRAQAIAARRDRVDPLHALVVAAVALASEAEDDSGWICWGWNRYLFEEADAELSKVQILSLGDREVASDFLRFRRGFGSLYRTLGVYQQMYQDEMEGTGPGPHMDDDTDWVAKHKEETLAAGADLLVRLTSYRDADTLAL